MDPYIPQLAEVLGTIVSGLVSIVLLLVAKKLKLDTDEKLDAKLAYVAAQAGRAVEERSKAVLKQFGRTMTPAEKLAEGVEIVTAELPRVTLSKAKTSVEAHLHQEGLGARASLGKAWAGATPLS